MSTGKPAVKRAEDINFFIKEAPGAFSAEELPGLIQLVDSDAEPGSVGAMGKIEGAVNEQVRRSRITWLPAEQHGWIYERMQQIAWTANRRYGYAIDGFQSSIQISLYDASEQGFYDWHTDMGPQLMTRKISISVPLNDDTEYEGGRLEFQTGARIIPIQQKAGSAVIFPGFVLHRVTPVTRGRRYSMVVWIKGPAWR